MTQRPCDRKHPVSWRLGLEGAVWRALRPMLLPALPALGRASAAPGTAPALAALKVHVRGAVAGGRESPAGSAAAAAGLPAAVTLGRGEPAAARAGIDPPSAASHRPTGTPAMTYGARPHAATRTLSAPTPTHCHAWQHHETMPQPSPWAWPRRCHPGSAMKLRRIPSGRSASLLLPLSLRLLLSKNLHLCDQWS